MSRMYDGEKDGFEGWHSKIKNPPWGKFPKEAPWSVPSNTTIKSTPHRLLVIAESLGITVERIAARDCYILEYPDGVLVEMDGMALAVWSLDTRSVIDWEIMQFLDLLHQKGRGKSEASVTPVIVKKKIVKIKLKPKAVKAKVTNPNIRAS